MYVVAMHHDLVVSLYDKLSIASDMSEKRAGFSVLTAKALEAEALLTYAATRFKTPRWTTCLLYTSPSPRDS